MQYIYKVSAAQRTSLPIKAAHVRGLMITLRNEVEDAPGHVMYAFAIRTRLEVIQVVEK